MASNRVDTILQLYGFKRDPQTTWRIQGNDVIRHHVLELIALDLGIKWSDPTVVHAERDACVVLVRGHVGEEHQWSFGEAAVGLNYQVSGKQAGYPYAMAEKRGKDRVIYKFLRLQDASEPENMEAAEPVKTAEQLAAEMSVVQRFEHNIKRKKDIAELQAWLDSEPVRLARSKLSMSDAETVVGMIRDRIAALSPSGEEPQSLLGTPESFAADLAMAISSAKSHNEVETLMNKRLEEAGTTVGQLSPSHAARLKDVVDRKIRSL